MRARNEIHLDSPKSMVGKILFSAPLVVSTDRKLPLTLIRLKSHAEDVGFLCEEILQNHRYYQAE